MNLSLLELEFFCFPGSNIISLVERSLLKLIVLLTQVTSRVPQGGHLSPYLCNLFVNSLGVNLPNAEILLNAVDIRIFHKIKSMTDCQIL